MIYLDHAATTKMDQSVIDVVSESMAKDYANASALYMLGVDALSKIDKVKNSIRKTLHLPSHFKILFTSGGSESNNLFVKGLPLANKNIALLGVEHPSVYNAVHSIKEPECVFRLNHDYGVMGTGELESLKAKNVGLLCLSHINNELGAINDVSKVASVLKKHSSKTKLFVDGVQAIGKFNFTPQFWDGVSGYSFAAHKFYGPKGIGVLIFDSKIDLKPLVHGGSQQNNLRAGTLPTALILGLEKSLVHALNDTHAYNKRIRELHALLIEKLDQLQTVIPGLTVRYNSLKQADGFKQSPSIVNFSFPPVEGEVMMHHLEQSGIIVGTGSACSASTKEPSKILLNSGLTREEALCSLRVSFGKENTKHDVLKFIEEFAKNYKALLSLYRDRKMSHARS